MNVWYVKGGRALWVQRLRGWNLLAWEWEEGFWVTGHLQSSVSENLLPKMDRNTLLRLTGGLESIWRNIANTWIGLNEHGCWQWKQQKEKRNSIWSPDPLGIAEWSLSSPYVDSFCFLSEVFQELTPRKAGSRLEKKNRQLPKWETFKPPLSPKSAPPIHWGTCRLTSGALFLQESSIKMWLFGDKREKGSQEISSLASSRQVT